MKKTEESGSFFSQEFASGPESEPIPKRNREGTTGGNIGLAFFTGCLLWAPFMTFAKGFLLAIVGVGTGYAVAVPILNAIDRNFQHSPTKRFLIKAFVPVATICISFPVGFLVYSAIQNG